MLRRNLANHKITFWTLAVLSAGFGLAVLTSCVSLDVFQIAPSFDRRRLTIQTMPLYNQRTSPAQKKWRWQGDWIFRRERLDRIDEELRTVKPDILFFQEAMQRAGHRIESDKGILKAGALLGYSWQSALYRSYYDTDEQELAVVAAVLPLKFASKPSYPQMYRFQDGYFTTFLVESEGQLLILMNLQEPSNDPQQIWWQRLYEQVEFELAQAHVCSKRLILAGHIRASNHDQHVKKILDRFNLKDVSDGICEQESSCYTASPQNELFRTVHTDQAASRDQRIYVHRSTIVHSSARNFDRPYPFPYRLRSSYALKSLWPSTRFGWVSTVRLARCQSNTHMQ